MFKSPEGDENPTAPGYYVECHPDLQGHQLVCMHGNDFDCSVRDYYVRESICADRWGGTPADYDGKPELAGAPYAGIVDCDVIPKPAPDDPQTAKDEFVPLIHHA